MRLMRWRHEPKGSATTAPHEQPVPPTGLVPAVPALPVAHLAPSLQWPFVDAFPSWIGDWFGQPPMRVEEFKEGSTVVLRLELPGVDPALGQFRHRLVVPSRWLCYRSSRGFAPWKHCGSKRANRSARPGEMQRADHFGGSQLTH